MSHAKLLALALLPLLAACGTTASFSTVSRAGETPVQVSEPRNEAAASGAGESAPACSPSSSGETLSRAGDVITRGVRAVADAVAGVLEGAVLGAGGGAQVAAYYAPCLPCVAATMAAGAVIGAAAGAVTGAGESLRAQQPTPACDSNQGAGNG